MDREIISEWFRGLQDRICAQLEAIDGKSKFREDEWVHAEGGGGRTRVLLDGAVFEKGGVNFSAVEGNLPPMLEKELGIPGTNKFFATGVSIVIHPGSPMVPIIHMNVRYFETTSGHHWFGGGIDLTPIYLAENDAKYFHQSLKKVCDRHHERYYDDFKKWADDYFFIKHRNETRGVGGIFFDRLADTGKFSMEMRWEFVKDIGDLFAPVYTEIVKRNRDKAFTPANKQWQLIRRGRYAEFNLVYDKGTRFGLETSGRTESILMSLPKEVSWLYDHKPGKGSDEEKALSMLRKGLDWIK